MGLGIGSAGIWNFRYTTDGLSVKKVLEYRTIEMKELDSVMVGRGIKRIKLKKEIEKLKSGSRYC
jgi:hypothetical protein